MDEETKKLDFRQFFEEIHGEYLAKYFLQMDCPLMILTEDRIEDKLELTEAEQEQIKDLEYASAKKMTLHELIWRLQYHLIVLVNSFISLFTKDPKFSPKPYFQRFIGHLSSYKYKMRHFNKELAKRI